MTDPFGRAIRDQYRDERTDPLIDRDGDDCRRHRIEDWYFGDHSTGAWRDSWMKGPLLDMGAGAGRDALYYQEQFETVAIDRSSHLVEVMRERGVTDARHGDMFSLPEQFDRDRFRSAHAIGTQIGLAGSMAGLRTFLNELATVTTATATAVLDNYAPAAAASESVFGFRADPAPGLGFRVYHCEYDGDVGRTLLFRLFSVDRLREATIGTSWSVVDSRQLDVQWRAILEKQQIEKQCKTQ